MRYLGLESAAFVSLLPEQHVFTPTEECSVLHMDGDPLVEPELDSFSRFLPLPYRVAIIFVCGNETVPMHAE